MKHEIKNVVRAGTPIDSASRALIMVHGRGADAADILGLSGYLNLAGYTLLAPEATGHQWYPYSFLEKPEKNEPGLSSALQLLADLVDELSAKGFTASQIYLLGFSQGACLTLEFATRHAQRWGGIAAFTGGLIGDKIYTENYHGDFNQTPVFMGCGDHDPHIPLQRIQETERQLKAMNANVRSIIYKNRPHTITQDEIEQVNQFVFAS